MALGPEPPKPEPPKRGPSLWWLAVAAAVFLLGLVPLLWTGIGIFRGIADYEIHDFTDQAANVDVEADDQIAIFATNNDSGTVTCRAIAENGDETALDNPSTNLTYTFGSETWERVAVTPEDLEPGEYTLRCQEASPNGGPQPAYGYADNPSILSGVLGVLIGLGVAGLATLTALAIVLVVAIKRSKAKQQRPRYPEFPPNPPQYPGGPPGPPAGPPYGPPTGPPQR